MICFFFKLSHLFKLQFPYNCILPCCCCSCCILQFIYLSHHESVKLHRFLYLCSSGFYGYRAYSLHEDVSNPPPFRGRGWSPDPKGSGDSIVSVPRPWITVTSRHSAIGGGGFLYLPFCLCLCSCGVRLCVFVFVGIQFSVLAALNVSELSCSPSFLPLFSFFRRLLQSPIAYGFQISDVFFWVFLCIRCVRFCMHLSTSNTGIFFLD